MDQFKIQETTDSIRELHRQRMEFHRVEKSMTLRIKAICRRLCDGDTKEADNLYKALMGKGEHEHQLYADITTAPLFQARDLLKGHRLDAEKRMVREAKELPAADWVAGVRGLGLPSLAAIVGEAGNLSSYPTVSKLWKRLGLAVIDGGRQRKVGGAAALEHGYDPVRRSIVWNMGDALFKTQSGRYDKETGEELREPGKYRRIYDQRKAYELERVETKAHAHNRAKRYMEKEVIKDLWKNWL